MTGPGTAEGFGSSPSTFYIKESDPSICCVWRAAMACFPIMRAADSMPHGHRGILGGLVELASRGYVTSSTSSFSAFGSFYAIFPDIILGRAGMDRDPRSAAAGLVPR